MPLRILYYTLHDLALPSGPTSHVRAVVTRLRGRGHHVTVVGTTSDPARTQDLDVANCGVFAGRGSHLTRARRMAAAVRHARDHLAARAADHDVMYARHFTAARCVPPGMPLVYEVNGLAVDEALGPGGPVRRATAWAVERALRATVRRAAHVVAVTDALRLATRETFGVANACLSTIPNGVDTQLVRPADAAARARMRTAWGWPQDAPVAGIIGNLGLRQRTDWLFSAWPQVVAQFPAARILLLGPGGELTQWADTVRTAGLTGQVLCRGPVPESELTDVYAGLDVALQLISADARGGQPGGSLKVRTALAAGVPVVATTHPDLAFLEGADVGGCVPEADPTAIARAVITLFADVDMRKRLGRTGRAYAEQHLDWDVAVDAIEAILNAAVRGAGR